MTRLAAAAAAALLASSCTLDAVFDFGVRFGPSDGVRVIVVEAATTDAEPGAPWDGEGLHTASGEGTQLDARGGEDVLASVVTEDGADHGKPLRMRVRLCSSVACRNASDERAPEAHVVIERAFYEGEATSWTLDATDESIFRVPGSSPDGGVPVPDAGSPDPDLHPCEQPGPIGVDGVIEVPRCRVRGCLAGSTECFCRRDGTHYCED